MRKGGDPDFDVGEVAGKTFRGGRRKLVMKGAKGGGHPSGPVGKGFHWVAQVSGTQAYDSDLE